MELLIESESELEAKSTWIGFCKRLEGKFDFSSSFEISADDNEEGEVEERGEERRVEIGIEERKLFSIAAETELREIDMEIVLLVRFKDEENSI